MTAIGLIREFIVRKSYSGGIFASSVAHWITAYCVMTFWCASFDTSEDNRTNFVTSTNIYGTAVIAYRIWSLNKALKSAGLVDGGPSLAVSHRIFTILLTYIDQCGVLGGTSHIC